MAVVMMVVPVMTMVEVPAVVMMMPPPAGVGIQHLRAERRSLDDGRMRRRPVGSRERRRGENGNGEQACGNRLEHLVSS